MKIPSGNKGAAFRMKLSDNELIELADITMNFLRAKDEFVDKLIEMDERALVGTADFGRLSQIGKASEVTFSEHLTPSIDSLERILFEDEGRLEALFAKRNDK